jgi:hypothetical protein
MYNFLKYTYKIYLNLINMSSKEHFHLAKEIAEDNIYKLYFIIFLFYAIII